MISGGRIEGGARIRRLVQAIERQDRRITEPIKAALERGAERIEAAIRSEIIAQGAVDEGDLFDAVGKKKLSNGFRWKIGYFKKGNLRKWRLAGWRAHFVEFGTRTQRPRPVVRQGFRSQLRPARAEIRRETRRALRRFAR
ncbi:HK97-gp10 family putative phage morphogenesis protein [Marinicauda algicola]|uniref:HK97-gp10 family putative phage morphogenesis protein n=1 Tax=Marinicauda algicola TaxID=2029849 RepID=UPI0013052B94|nr:HK97-gp10 family putative phage morphogenesis protein [Marinicauda algicola]